MLFKEKLIAATAGAAALSMGFGVSGLALAQANTSVADNSAAMVRDANLNSDNSVACGYGRESFRFGGCW